jgi:hypothetical protein
MRSPLRYLNSLSISPYGKTIPYAGSGLVRADGNANYGFKNLKIKPDLIEAIPELASDKPLKSLVLKLNTNSNFFSTGCFSQAIRESQSYRHRGYIEFSFNCRFYVQDARNYFSLFFHFENFLRQHHFSESVEFDWKIEEAYFSDIGIQGFSCAIFVRTADHSSCENTHDCWQRSLQILESFFVSAPNPSSVAIYQSSPTLQEPHFGYIRI